MIILLSAVFILNISLSFSLYISNYIYSCVPVCSPVHSGQKLSQIICDKRLFPCILHNLYESLLISVVKLSNNIFTAVTQKDF